MDSHWEKERLKVSFLYTENNVTDKAKRIKIGPIEKKLTTEIQG